MTPRNLILVGSLLVIIGLLIAYLLRPAPQPEIIGDLSPAEENALKENLLILEGQNDSLRRELDKSKADGKTAQEAFNREIKAKAKTIAELKNRPIVVKLVQENPELDSLHQAYDSSMVAYEGRVVSLTMEMQMRDQINAQIQANFERRLSLTEQLLADRTLELEQAMRENKKLRRRLFFTKVGGVIVLGAVVVLSL